MDAGFHSKKQKSKSQQCTNQTTKNEIKQFRRSTHSNAFRDQHCR